MSMPMNTFLSELVDIFALIIPDDEPIFNEDESLELYETCLHLMEEFVKNNPTMITEPDFDDIFEDNINELMEAVFAETDIFYLEEDLDEILSQAKTDFFKDFMPIRSYPDSVILEEPDYEYVEGQIAYLKSKPQPVQRTKEWYDFRHNLITASNAYKAFESQSNKNQLIYEKCQPNPSSSFTEDLDSDSASTSASAVDSETKIIHFQAPVQMVNVNSSLHHGQKYEPLSVMIYEDTYKTKVDDFGCIQHETQAFLGASPDGINVDRDSSRYGRMLEIKNIVNREIDGIPKKEYWIQMQLQMEVCDLDECDFLETKFTEYENAGAYWADTSGKRKGIIMYFHAKEGKPFYKYMPLSLVEIQDIDKWQEEMMDLYQSYKYKYVWIKDYYWKLDIVSCVLVCRNRQWFKDNIEGLAEIWSTIVSERVSGYEHRAPNRKPKPTTLTLDMDASNNSTGSGCLLNFNKENGKVTVVKSEAKPNAPIGNLNIHPFFQIKS
jgi:putative phage-type endonuclease